MDVPNFSTTEFLKMQHNITSLTITEKELHDKITAWFPEITINAIPEQRAVSFTCRYGLNGFTKQLTVKYLSELSPEMIEDLIFELATLVVETKIKDVSDMMRREIIRATLYAKMEMNK